MIGKINDGVVHIRIAIAQLCSTLGEMLLIPADLSTPREIKVSYTSGTVIVIECKESSTVGKSSMLGSDVELGKIEWKCWLNKLALLEPVLAFSESRFIAEGILLDLVMDLRYLNILLLLDKA